tara:strand:- start:1546 stop:1701 length:156 start_codon:yes stop_codon:yes gene_type:complete
VVIADRVLSYTAIFSGDVLVFFFECFAFFGFHRVQAHNSQIGWNRGCEATF